MRGAFENATSHLSNDADSGPIPVFAGHGAGPAFAGYCKQSGKSSKQSPLQSYTRVGEGWIGRTGRTDPTMERTSSY
jgi:hypothetical protein